MLVFKTCNGFITAKFEEWRRQLGSYIIDYNSVILEEVIAKGLRMKMAILVKLHNHCCFVHVLFSGNI